jgi:DNA mismatch repair ATPase MutS
VAYIGLYLTQSGTVRGLFEDAFRLEQTLRRFRAVLLYLESRSYGRTPHLATLCRPFWQAQPRPSAILKRVVRLAGMASAQRANIFGVALNLLVPWDLFVAYRFNQCKQDVKTRLPEWIDTWYELEALNALANFGYLQPDARFPEMRATLEVDSEPVLRANALGHPLLPDEVRVCNDLTLARLGEVVMITGSNMSGKSTFLRTLGINLCLAYAGAPVCATALQCGLMRVFTCINVSDSVTDGISYFYAEVKRLKALLQALSMPSETPLLFLIDEIFRGTNNRERLIGSQSFIEALSGGNGVGLVSTHDLELVTLAESMPTIHNYHFRETIVDGRMAFDYELRPGPCPTTNALTIMQLEGLPVPSPSGSGIA